MEGIKKISDTFLWCLDTNRLAIYDKQVFCVDRDGTRWWLNGEQHRKNGPAVEFASGGKWWYLNDQLHRENGPAIEFTSGYRSWFLNGVYYPESDYWKEMKK